MKKITLIVAALLLAGCEYSIYNSAIQKALITCGEKGLEKLTIIEDRMKVSCADGAVYSLSAPSMHAVIEPLRPQSEEPAAEDTEDPEIFITPKMFEKFDAEIEAQNAE